MLPSYHRSFAAKRDVSSKYILAACISAACGLAQAGALTTSHANHLTTSPLLPNSPVVRTPTHPNGTPCGTITVTQSTSQDIVTGNSVSCNNGTGHSDNSYYRAFDLATSGAPDGLDVCEVQVGVEQATSASGTQPVTINLYTSDPLFPDGFPSSLTSIGTTTADVADQSASILSVPVTGSAASGSQLVVEVFTPNGEDVGNLFFIGSNTATENGPSYIYAPDCGLTSPVATGDIGFPDMHIVMNVIGNAGGAGDDTIFADGFDGVPTVAPTLDKAFAPASIAPGETSVLTLTLANANASAATLSADLVDTFPTGLVIADPSDAATTCDSGTATGTAGGDTLTLGTGAQIPAAGSCTVTVTVTAADAGTYTNTIAAGGLQTDLGNSETDATADLTVAVASTQPVQDSGFEATTTDAGTNPFWESLDGNPSAGGGTSFYSNTGFGIPTHGGDWTVWFGGWRTGDAETQNFQQSVTMPSSGPAFLNYWRFVSTAPDAAGNLTISVDGTAVDTTDLSAVTDTDYTQFSVDISTYADGAAHLIDFTFDYPGGAQDGDIFIDDVTVDPTGTTVTKAPGSAATRPSVLFRKLPH